MPRISAWWQQEYEYSAYHEAGHALAFSLLGIGQGGIVIRIRKPLFGREKIEAYTVTDAEQERAAHPNLLAVATLAGPMAEAIHIDQVTRMNFRDALKRTMYSASGEADMIDLKDCLRRGNLTERQVIRRTQVFIEDHWRRVDKIARRVMRRGDLTARQVDRMSGVNHA